MPKETNESKKAKTKQTKKIPNNKKKGHVGSHQIRCSSLSKASVITINGKQSLLVKRHSQTEHLFK